MPMENDQPLSHHLLTMAYNNAWANHRLLGACVELTQSDFIQVRTSFFPSIRATLNHNLTVDWFYVAALEREAQGQPPDPDSARCFAITEPFDNATALVLDTNILLDVWVFGDPAAAPLRSGLPQGHWRWMATPPMRDELARVLTYPHIVKRLSHQRVSPQIVLGHFDAHAELATVAPKASVTCKDPDDQKFIDLAVAHSAILLSKDRAVLCMQKRLLALGVSAGAAINSIAS